jgi:hypothetical protein
MRRKPSIIASFSSFCYINILIFHHFAITKILIFIILLYKNFNFFNFCQVRCLSCHTRLFARARRRLWHPALCHSHSHSHSGCG